MIRSLEATAAVETIIFFLEMCDDLLLERVDVGSHQSSPWMFPCYQHEQTRRELIPCVIFLFASSLTTFFQYLVAHLVSYVYQI